MRASLQNKLLKRFPVLYQEFYDSMQETCMMWGFEVCDGWFDLLWNLSLAIEKELGYTWTQKRWFLFKKWAARDWNNTIYRLSPPRTDDVFARFVKRFFPHPIEDAAYWSSTYCRLSCGLKALVWWPETGFSVKQVKEKFGTLCYYTDGCTNAVDKLISAAEVESAVICETCGDPGKMRNSTGWYRVQCDECQKIRDDEDREPNGLERAVKKMTSPKKKKRGSK